ncbi:hypothetical protein HJC23_011492 [Cyclotella cryptica]|uniref:Purine permease n=1 Tax=Cyclotella cryptica TaxID=29204 RepID=A0ABD3PW02_9STRA|eukprot:CCRYP_011279-RA/>CCRYP_011279-RA protein AED:0.00 eAED:0.00 QI:275/1/1/1/1/1/2/112/605
MGLKSKILGDGEGYDYHSLCMPTVPWAKKKMPVFFYPLDEPLPILLSLIMGLQHAFAMVGGLITPPYVVMKFTVDGFPFTNVELQQYAIVAALITSGISTFINVAQVKIPFSEMIFKRPIYIGSGLLSVMGTSFTFLPIFEIAIRTMMMDGIPGEDAYGKMLGTSMLCALLEVAFSLLPGKLLQRVFPPVVTAITVTLLGVALVGTGMKYWGGGVVCGEMIWKEHSQVVDSVGFGMPVSDVPSAVCTGNGKVQLPYGSAEYIGLGFSVLCFLVVIELFGSTFMKNCNVILALLFGYFVAAVSNYDGEPYINTQNIKDAPVVDFLWTQWFGIGLYAPAIVPMLIAYIVTTVETIGDVSATHEVSQLSTDTKEYTHRIQGSLMADAICSMLASVFTSMPNTTFSQNNGVIAMTKCASRRAGYATGFWLILMGVFAKIAGVITSIPDAVLGGMTIFLFANVFVSGISLFGKLNMKSRRIRFISAMSLSVGVGVTVWPWAFQDMRASSYTAAFWECGDCSEFMKGVRNGVSIFLSTGYCVGSVIAILLNLIIPEDPEGVVVDGSIHWSIIGNELNAKGMDGDIKDEVIEIDDDAVSEKAKSSEDDISVA